MIDKTSPIKIAARFYQNTDVISVAKALLGKQLCTIINGQYCSGIIVETEAYKGVLDKASHAFGARRTARTEIMYREGGVAYVYLCYGIHYLFNVVTGPVDEPFAVLIRGLEPAEGIDIMLKRRGMMQMAPRISAGPALLTQALGIDININGANLDGDEVWIQESGLNFTDEHIVTTERIGVGYAAEDALLPYRFYIRGNRYVSKVLKERK